MDVMTVRHMDVVTVRHMDVVTVWNVNVRHMNMVTMRNVNVWHVDVMPVRNVRVPSSSSAPPLGPGLDFRSSFKEGVSPSVRRCIAVLKLRGWKSNSRG
jgi:hypothetical protein